MTKLVHSFFEVINITGTTNIQLGGRTVNQT